MELRLKGTRSRRIEAIAINALRAKQWFYKHVIFELNNAQQEKLLHWINENGEPAEEEKRVCSAPTALQPNSEI